ncbi:24032_t:CDS:2, partial [Racocetra persica]
DSLKTPTAEAIIIRTILRKMTVSRGHMFMVTNLKKDSKASPQDQTAVVHKLSKTNSPETPPGV